MKNIKQENFSEIIKIIEAGLEGNTTKVKTYSELLLSKLRNPQQRKMILDRITGKYKDMPKILVTN